MKVICECGWPIYGENFEVKCPKCSQLVRTEGYVPPPLPKPRNGFCQCGYHATVSKSTCVTCPLCQERFFVRSKEDQGRYAWKLLHGEENPTRDWYVEWLREVPAYDCACADEWADLTRKNPPDFSSAEAFKAWAVARHNDVNRRLGKPQWPANASE